GLGVVEGWRVSSEAFWVGISESFSTWLKVAVCAMNSELLAGFAGSWYFIWATSSFRKVSLPIWSGRSTVEDAPGVYVVPVDPLTGAVIGRSLLLRGAGPRRTAWIGYGAAWVRSLGYRQVRPRVVTGPRPGPADRCAGRR